MMRSIVLTTLILGAGWSCGQGQNAGSESRSIPIDAVTYDDPLCAPNPMTGAACITPLPGGSVFVRRGFRYAELGTLRASAATVKVVVHSAEAGLDQVGAWFVVTNGVRKQV